MKYLDNLGNMRRRAQNRKYQQVKIEKEKGADACTRRRNFQKAMLRGPEYVLGYILHVSIKIYVICNFK